MPDPTREDVARPVDTSRGVDGVNRRRFSSCVLGHRYPMPWKGLDQALNASPLRSALSRQSADLRVADRAHRKSSGALADTPPPVGVVNVVDENLTTGEGGL